VPRGRFSPQPLRAYVESTVDLRARIDRSSFCEKRNLAFDYGEEDGERFHGIEGTVLCLDGIRVQLAEKCRFDRESWRAPRGPNRILRLVEYSYTVSLSRYGNIFRYDGPDEVQTSETPPHHKVHHRHSFDVFGSWEIIWPPDEIKPHEVPTPWQVVKEAETWYYENQARIDALLS
jgi:hypothetical protein